MSQVELWMRILLLCQSYLSQIYHVMNNTQKSIKPSRFPILQYSLNDVVIRETMGWSTRSSADYDLHTICVILTADGFARTHWNVVIHMSMFKKTWTRSTELPLQIVPLHEVTNWVTWSTTFITVLVFLQSVWQPVHRILPHTSKEVWQYISFKDDPDCWVRRQQMSCHDLEVIGWNANQTWGA